MCLGECFRKSKALKKGKVDPFSEPGVFDEDQKEEERSESLTLLDVDVDEDEELTWLNDHEVQLSSSGAIIPVPRKMAKEEIPVNSEEDTWKCIEALNPMRETLGPIYGGTVNKEVNLDSDIFIVLGNAHELDYSPTEVQVVPKQPWMLVGGRQRQFRWTLLRDILMKHIEDSEEFLYVSVFVFTDLALWRCIQRKATNSPNLRITIMLCEMGSGPGLASMKEKTGHTSSSSFILTLSV